MVIAKTVLVDSMNPTAPVNIILYLLANVIMLVGVLKRKDGKRQYKKAFVYSIPLYLIIGMVVHYISRRQGIDLHPI
jgi:hypothetical protein